MFFFRGGLCIDSVSRSCSSHPPPPPRHHFTQLCHTPSFTHTHTTLSQAAFHTELCHIPSSWHLSKSTFLLRGSHGAYVTWLGTFPVGLALGHFAGRRGTLRGRCGSWRHRHCVCVAWVALRDTHAVHLSLKYEIVTHTHNFVTHNLSHVTYLSHVQTHATLSRATLSHTTPSHTSFSHTHTHTRIHLSPTQLCHPQC